VPVYLFNTKHLTLNYLVTAVSHGLDLRYPQIYLSILVEMRLFALYIMQLALTIYLTLNLVVTTVLHLPEPMLYVRQYRLETVSLYCLTKTIIGINELNHRIESHSRLSRVIILCAIKSLLFRCGFPILCFFG